MCLLVVTLPVIAMKPLICLYQTHIRCVSWPCSFWSTQETIMKTPSRRRRALSAVVIPHVMRTVQSTKHSRYASMVLLRESKRWAFIVHFATQLLIWLLNKISSSFTFNAIKTNFLIREATCQEFNSGRMKNCAVFTQVRRKFHRNIDLLRLRA